MLKYPVFVKPANLGSSVGITKAHDAKELASAIETAARFDRKIVVERGVGGKKDKARALEVAAFRVCDCAGLARLDFLMEPGKSGKIYVNEINTLPGFTSISMYPRLWAASGVPYPKLIDRLIELAMERRADKDRNRYSL